MQRTRKRVACESPSGCFGEGRGRFNDTGNRGKQFAAPLHASLVKDVGDVELHRALGNFERAADLAVGKMACSEVSDAELATWRSRVFVFMPFGENLITL